MLIYDKYVVDTDLCIVTYDNQIISLTRTQYLLLTLFLKFPNQIFTCEQIAEYLKTDVADYIADSTVRSHIKFLRQSLRENSADYQIIENVRGLGYRLRGVELYSNFKNIILSPPINVLKNLLYAQKIEYFVFDKNLKIKALSQGISKYCNFPNNLEINCDLKDTFPSLLKYRGYFKKIIDNKNPYFMINDYKVNINNKFSFFNIYVLLNSNQNQENKQLIVFFEPQENQDKKNEIQGYSYYKDSLTGTPGKLYFIDFIDWQIEQYKRYQFLFTIAYLDIENFKNIKDNYGQNCANDLLGSITQLVAAQSRSVDLFARIGEARFALLLSKTTFKIGDLVLERLSQKLLSKKLLNTSLAIEFKITAFTFEDVPDSSIKILEVLDQLVLKSKQQTSNRIYHQVYKNL